MTWLCSNLSHLQLPARSASAITYSVSPSLRCSSLDLLGQLELARKLTKPRSARSLRIILTPGTVTMLSDLFGTL